MAAKIQILDKQINSFGGIISQSAHYGLRGSPKLPVTFDYDNQRGSSERTFDMQNNDFGWKPLPFSSPLTWVGKLVRSRRQNALSEAKGRVCGN